MTLETSYDITSAGVAGIVFQPLATSDFQSIAQGHGGGRQGDRRRHAARPSRPRDDDYGFRWLIVRDQAVEDLVVAINGVSTSIEDGGYGERLLCAVFAFKDADGAPINFIYNYKRGSWYPFVPAAGDTAAHDRARAAAEGADRRRAADRAGARALVPALGRPVLAAGR